MKQLPIELDDRTAHELGLRSTIENRPLEEIVGSAIRDYVDAHPITREGMLTIARAIMAEDADILEALARA